MKTSTVFTLSLSVLFVAVGFLLRGHGTWHRDVELYTVGMAMISIGLLVLGIELYNLIRRRKNKDI